MPPPPPLAAAAAPSAFDSSPPSGQVTEDNDPTLFCAAFKRSRFYLFSTREPLDPDGDDATGRDVFNEKPSKEDLELAARANTGPLPRMACINTSYGEVRIRLFPDECPKSVENFVTHAQNGYYDGVIFHRVIKGFMCQTGDPLGDGTGGTSIWGHEFEDEFHRSLRHDRPFTLSMANAVPSNNSNRSSSFRNIKSSSSDSRNKSCKRNSN